MTTRQGGSWKARFTRIGIFVCLGIPVLAICRRKGWTIDFAVVRASFMLLLMIVLLGAWAIRSVVDRTRGVKSRPLSGEGRATIRWGAGGHLALGLIALGLSVALFAIIRPHSGPQVDLIAIAVGTTSAGIWLGLWIMDRGRKRAVATAADVQPPPARAVAVPEAETKGFGQRQPLTAPVATPAKPWVLQHLYACDGSIAYSAEIDGDVPQTHVAQAVLSARPGMANFKNLLIRDAVFENLSFDNRNIEDCVFENVRFDGVSSAANWHLRRCRLERCRFEGSHLNRSNVADCTFVDVDMTEIYIAASFDNCTLTNVRFSLDSRRRDMTVGLWGNTLHNVTFAGADIPEIPHIYSKVHAEIVRRGGGAPRHATAWLYNILLAVFGDVWRQLAERHGLATALPLIFYYNSADTRFLPFGDGQAVLDHIRAAALAEAGKGA